MGEGQGVPGTVLVETPECADDVRDHRSFRLHAHLPTNLLRRIPDYIHRAVVMGAG